MKTRIIDFFTDCAKVITAPDELFYLKSQYKNYEGVLTSIFFTAFLGLILGIYLKDIIVGYFIINNKWLPKDKKLFKSLKDENIELFRLCKKVIENYEYKDLINVYKYIFI